MNIFNTVLLVIFLSTMAYADRGAIPYDRNVKIFEPNQNAVIAYDGKQEILLLSTDMSASKETKVLELIPLPSQPIVTKGDIHVFKKITDLINKRIKPQDYLTFGRNRTRQGVEGNLAVKGIQSIPAGEITFHEKIGVNEIIVTHVVDSNGFIDWVNGYFTKNGIKNQIIPKEMTDLITEYLKNNFSWFVFDVIELNNKTKTLEPIEYKFESKSLFYPLKISSRKEGNTEITLSVITPQLFSNFSGISIQHIDLPHEPLDITGEDFKEISEDIYNTIGKPASMKLRTWTIYAFLDSFKEDLMASGFVGNSVSAEENQYYLMKHITEAYSDETSGSTSPNLR